MMPDSVRWAPQREFFLTSVNALNLPAGLIQLPYIVTSPSKREWMPVEMDFRVWRVITWPLLCLPFWWIAGRAADALIAIKRRQLTPRIGWPETIAGFLIIVLFAIGFAGLLFGLPKADRTPELTRFLAGCGLWVFLGSLTVIAQFRQFRLRKAMRKESDADGSLLHPYAQPESRIIEPSA
ncbi:MAG TPA: hypothetical protein VFF39_04760 [Verrucomicrobiae bacterium]|nr:hypothetical protein [Verrucomicrobiae bacterium]